MRKYITITLLALFIGSGLSAQVSETKQLSADIEKLVQLKLILDNMIKGYSILSKGYNTISDISKGNFNLHKEYLDALWTVSAAIANDKRITLILVNQSKVVTEYATAWKMIAASQLSATDLSIIRSQYLQLLDQSVSAIEELYMIIHSGKLRMSDAERLAAIGVIDGDMTATLKEVRNLTENVLALNAGKSQAQKDTKNLKAIYGTKN